MFEFDGNTLSLTLSDENPQDKILLEQLRKKHEQAKTVPNDRSVPANFYKFDLSLAVKFSGCIAIDIYAQPSRTAIIQQKVIIINDYYKVDDIKLIEADQSGVKP